MQSFCIFLNLTVLLPERFTDTVCLHLRHPFRDSPESHPDAVLLFSKPLRVLLLRWAILPLSCSLLLAQYANNDFIIALVFYLSIPFMRTNVFFSRTFHKNILYTLFNTHRLSKLSFVSIYICYYCYNSCRSRFTCRNL